MEKDKLEDILLSKLECDLLSPDSYVEVPEGETYDSTMIKARAAFKELTWIRFPKEEK